jgi:hypothetical protein
MQSWILALQAISTSVWKCSSGLYGDDDPPAAGASEFAQFLKATLLKMLTFVDAIAALDPLNAGGASGQQHVFSSSSVVGAADKVRALLDVRHTVSAASEQIMMAFCSSHYLQWFPVEFSARNTPRTRPGHPHSISEGMAAVTTTPRATDLVSRACGC